MKFWYLPLFMLPNVKENKKYVLSFCKPIVLLSLLAGLYSASRLPNNALHLFMPIFINSHIFCGMLYPLSSNIFLHGVCSFLIQLLIQWVQIAVLFNIINFLTYVKWKYFLIFYQIYHKHLDLQESSIIQWTSLHLPYSFWLYSLWTSFIYLN